MIEPNKCHNYIILYRSMGSILFYEMRKICGMLHMSHTIFQYFKYNCILLKIDFEQ